MEAAMAEAAGRQAVARYIGTRRPGSTVTSWISPVYPKAPWRS